MSMMNEKGSPKSGATKEFAVTRVFDYPVEKVWRAWSDPDMLKRWWGPKGFTSNSAEMDFRVGGKYLWNMHGPDGKDYYSAGVFKEIVPMKKIVFTDSFADENGKIVPASYYGMGGDWPAELTSTVVFEEIDGGTKITVDEPGIPEEMKDLSVQGMKESLDKLEESLKQ